MSIQITYPTPTNIPRVKQFFWDVKDRRNIERGIGGYYNNDTTQVYTTSTTRVNLKTYTFTSSAYTNKIRVRIYAHLSANGTAYIYLNINGTDVASYSANPGTSPILVIDYIGSITPSASQTIKVDGYYSSTATIALYIDQVVIIAGFGLTSTTSVSILSITLDSANDVYTLNVSGNFVYKVGIRWWIKGNRKTTANASITSNLANEIQGYYSPSASNDGDNNAFINLRTGDYVTSFTISGYVGASGDVIIITGIYCQIVLRGNINSNEIKMNENGHGILNGLMFTVDGSNDAIVIQRSLIDQMLLLYQSGSSTSVTVMNIQFACNVNTYLRSWDGNDTNGKSFMKYLDIIVIGV
jgi:hypothetical protein